MKGIEQLLVVIDRPEDADGILAKAATLAAANESRVHVIRVIHESLVEYEKLSAKDSQTLKLFIMQAEEESLVDLLDKHQASFVDLDSAVIWNKRKSTGILDMVSDLDIDLVVKGTDTSSGHFRHPDDWNLVRDVPCPIMFVGLHPWPERPKITAAIDVLDIMHDEMNRKILSAADALAECLDGVLDIVSVYPRLVSLSSDDSVGVDFVQLKQDLDDELHTRVSKLVAGTSSLVESVRTDEGVPSEIIKKLTDESSDVVVVGSAARKGVSALVIGNTAEALLGRVSRDVLVLRV